MKTPQQQFTFGWQGGEPTLMGVEFFKKAVELQKQYAPKNAVIANGLQTNGLLIDDDFCKLFCDYRFLIGVSIDGPKHIHDKYRLDTRGAGSHEKVMQGVSKMQTSGVECNALVLVSKSNVLHAREVFRFLCDKGMFFQQYIPCVECDESGNPLPFSITGDEWGQFLCELYDIWKTVNPKQVSIRNFDAVMSSLFDGSVTVCPMGTDCRQYFVVEHNGDVYPCDFFVSHEWRLGNIDSNSWESMQASELYKTFGTKKTAYQSSCNSCKYLKLCYGDCQKHRIQNNLSTLCSGLKMFYEHTIPGLQALVDGVKKERARSEKIQQANEQRVSSKDKKIGRNSPCPCGSGKKYKKCCGK